jgi:hypothetical protein
VLKGRAHVTDRQDPSQQDQIDATQAQALAREHIARIVPSPHKGIAMFSAIMHWLRAQRTRIINRILTSAGYALEPVRLHTWTEWEVHTEPAAGFAALGGARSMRYQQRHCTRCNLHQERSLRGETAACDPVAARKTIEVH